MSHHANTHAGHWLRVGFRVPVQNRTRRRRGQEGTGTSSGVLALEMRAVEEAKPCSIPQPWSLRPGPLTS